MNRYNALKHFLLFVLYQISFAGVFSHKDDFDLRLSQTDISLSDIVLDFLTLIALLISVPTYGYIYLRYILYRERVTEDRRRRRSSKEAEISRKISCERYNHHFLANGTHLVAGLET